MKNTLIGQCLLILLCLFMQQTLRAQMNQALWHANHVGYRMPGTVPQEGLVVQLPAIGIGMYNSGFSYNDLVASTNNGITTLDVDGVLDKMDNENTLMIQGAIQTLGVGWKMNNLWVELGHQVRYENFLDYPRDLFSVFFRGNAGFIGQTANLGLKVNSMLYNEFYVGAAGQIGKVSIGGRLKWLNGALAARTERSQLDLYTSDDIYQLTVNSDYLIHTSPELDILKGGNSDLTLDLEDYEFSQLITRNAGFALDLGADVSITDRLSLSAAVMDIGRITWKDEVVSYASNKSIQYDGFEFSSLFSDDSLSLVGALDTLETLLEFEETEGGSFETALPWSFQIGGRYQLTEQIDVSAVFFGQRQSSYTFSGVSFGGNFRPLSFLEAGIAYTIYDKTYTNVGLHLLLKLGPVRVYGASDNVISLFSANDNRFANGRVGMQLAF
ncbi:MAG: hypothetical protein H6568_09470 [Lewinellaceae bacterium]|nr:hypothetical protein [Lewinellaceae bacterium]